jgi:hypothetical protein
LINTDGADHALPDGRLLQPAGPEAAAILHRDLAKPSTANQEEKLEKPRPKPSLPSFKRRNNPFL